MKKSLPVQVGNSSRTDGTILTSSLAYTGKISSTLWHLISRRIMATADRSDPLVKPLQTKE